MFTSPSQPDPTVWRAMELLLITTEDCHLCEHAHTVLERLGVFPRDVSVTSPEAAALAQRGIPLAFLPVLTDGEQVIAYGRLSERRLRRELSTNRVDG